MADDVPKPTAAARTTDNRRFSPGNLVRVAWAARQIILAGLVLVLALLSLWDALWRRPVAASFTRVGGPTRVETALEASRFWREPPTQVVTTPARGSREIRALENRVDAIRMGAARCAVRHDAPLLLTSPNRKRQLLVDRTIAEWRKKGGALEVIDIRNEDEVTACLRRRIPGLAKHLSTRGMPAIGEPDPQLTIPQVDAGQLEPTIVFAPSKSPADQPFIAVALALAAHMATKERPVSLVVVPRYLESAPELEDALRNRWRQVDGGILLGPTEVLPEDTGSVLRQVLNATGRSSLLGPLQSVLGSFDTLLAAILAVLGAGAASEGVEKFKQRGRDGDYMPLTRRGPQEPPDRPPSDSSSSPGAPEPGGSPTPTVANRTAPRSGTTMSAVLLCLTPPAILAAGWFLQPEWAWITVMLLLMAFIVLIGRHIVGLWRGAFVDNRNKISLSQFQAVLWTVLVVAGFLTAALYNVRGNQQAPLRVAVPEQLWVLLGISGTALVGSALIKSQKSTTTSTAKKGEVEAKMGPAVVRVEHTNLFVAAADPDNPRPTDPVVAKGVLTMNPHPRDSRWSDMFQAEEVGNKDHLSLEKIQMFYFTIILVLAYAAAMAKIFAAPTGRIDGLPLLEQSMVALLGISHATYLTGKAIPRTTTEDSA